MPVAARLSNRFYQRFGDDATNELVTWMNAIDAESRAALRELNELNFARFDALQGERLAELKAGLVRWMFLFWTGQTVALAGLLYAVRK